MLPPSSDFRLLPALPGFFFYLRMEVTCSSEMSVNFQRNTRHDIPAGRTLENVPVCRKNLKYGKEYYGNFLPG
jgi:hypothetical protein